MEDRTQAVAGGGPQTPHKILWLDRRRTKSETSPRAVHVHQPGIACPACGEFDMEDFAALTFNRAFPVWLENHRPFIAPRTYHDYQQYGAALGAFFGEIQLKDIGFGNVRGYQLWRSRATGETKGYEHGAGNVRIKNEINGVLKPILREADQWEGIKKKKFKHLPSPREGAGVLLDKEDQREILAIAFSKKRWLLAGHCLRIMYRSGCGFGELRRLRRQDIDLEAGTMTILIGAKNSGARVRTLTLTPSAQESLRWIIVRWEQKGGTHPLDYILPHRGTLKAGQDRFEKPMASIHWAWHAIRAKWIASNPSKKHKARARIYDARVSAATLLLANEHITLTTVEKALGWTPSGRMRKRYPKLEEKMLRDALNTLEDNQQPPSC